MYLHTCTRVCLCVCMEAYTCRVASQVVLSADNPIQTHTETKAETHTHKDTLGQAVLHVNE